MTVTPRDTGADRPPRALAAALGRSHGDWMRSRGIPFVTAATVYAVTAFVITWPLVVHLGSGIYLSPYRPYGDYTGTIADLHSLVAGFHIPFLPGHISAFNAPDGLPVNWGLNLVTFPEIMTLWTLGLVFGSIPAIGLFVLAGFVGSGLAMFGFVRMVTRSSLVALVAGWAFAFYPYAVANGEHPDYIHGWPFVLMAWAGLRALERPTVRSGVLAGLAAILAMAWTPYYLLLGGIAFAALVVAALIVGWRQRMLRAEIKAFAVASVLAAGYAIAVLGLSAVDPSAGTHAVNTITDVFQQSARPENYVLAPGWNPLLGSITGPTVYAHGWEFTEKTLYVGISLLVLALVGVGMAIARRLDRRQTQAVAVAGAIAIAALACSGPPQWSVLGVRLNLPSWYLFHLTSGFRIYERFVIVLEMGLCVLAAVGLASLLPRRRPLASILVVTALGAVVVLDLWGPIPNHFGRLRVPHIVLVLAKQPAGAYADYPLGPADQRPDYHDLFDQGYADRDVMNGFAAGTASDELSQTLANPQQPWVGGELATLGIRYILIEHHPIAPFTAVPPPRRGFVKLADDPYGALYRNVSAPIPVIQPLDGFSYDEGDPKTPFRWMIAPTGHILIRARCSPCAAELSFGAASFAHPRLVTIRNAATGRMLSSTRVAGEARIRVPLRFSGEITLAVRTTPGPESIHAATGSPDPRSVSVEIQAPTLAVSRAAATGSW